MTVRIMVGPGQLGQYEKRLAKELKAAQLRALHAVGKQGVRMLSFASASVKDRGSYQTGWRYRAAFNRLYLFNVSKHAVYVERGRRPGGRMPPIGVIMAWAERRGLPKKAAWGIAKKIAKCGIKARPLLRRPNIQAGLQSVFDRSMYGVFGDAARRAAT